MKTPADATKLAEKIRDTGSAARSGKLTATVAKPKEFDRPAPGTRPSPAGPPPWSRSPTRHRDVTGSASPRPAPRSSSPSSTRRTSSTSPRPVRRRHRPRRPARHPGQLTHPSPARAHRPTVARLTGPAPAGARSRGARTSGRADAHPAEVASASSRAPRVSLSVISPSASIAVSSAAAPAGSPLIPSTSCSRSVHLLPARWRGTPGPERRPRRSASTPARGRPVRAPPARLPRAVRRAAATTGSSPSVPPAGISQRQPADGVPVHRDQHDPARRRSPAPRTPRAPVPDHAVHPRPPSGRSTESSRTRIQAFSYAIRELRACQPGTGRSAPGHA